MAMAMASTTGGRGDDDDNQKVHVSSFDCEICFERFNSGRNIPKVINCGHTFCEGCVDVMVKNIRLECPTCRKPFPNLQADGFPTNFLALSLVEDEEYRVKSSPYKCSDCSISLSMDKAFVCKGDYGGVICLDCYSHHSDHGGIEPLKFLLNKNRPTFDGNLKRLIENRERYKALEADIEHRRASLESWINRLASTKDYITRVLDDLRSEIDEINRVCDDDSSSLLEKLIISGRVGSFFIDCYFGNGRLDWDLELVRRKFNTLETALSEMMKTEDDAGYSTAREKAHRFRPYLELLDSMAVSAGMGDPNRGGTQSAGTSAASPNRSTRVLTPKAVGFLSEPDDEASPSGRRLSGAVASSTIRSERGRGGFINKSRGGRS